MKPINATFYQLANDEETYKADAGKWIVVIGDCADEITGPMSMDDARKVAILLNACVYAVRYENTPVDKRLRLAIHVMLGAAPGAECPRPVDAAAMSHAIELRQERLDLVEYHAWIQDNWGTPEVCRKKCAQATEEMVAQFNRLTRVRGYYDDPLSGPQPHWWCKTASGEIVDPTAAQFTPGGEYEEHTGPEPTGQCLNCGKLLYDSNHTCSEACRLHMLKTLTGEAR